MKTPFKTSEDLKKSLSGIDLKFDIENIQSSLDRVPNDLLEVVGYNVYNDMISHFESPKTDNTDIWDELVSLCQKAMLPMAIYKHFIWLQLRVSNKGVTTYKGDDETTAYRYQTDEAKEALLDAWSDYVSQIIDHLNSNKDIITNWPLSDQYTAQSSSLFKDFREFSKIANIRPADAAFFLRISDMLLDIASDEVTSMLGPIADLDDESSKFRKAQKYTAFRAMSLSAVQFDISAMPKPMRQVLINEMNAKNNQGFDFAKKNLAGYYKTEAEAWLKKISDDINAESASESTEEIKHVSPINYSDNDKAVGIC